MSDFRTFQSELKVDCVPGNFTTVAITHLLEQRMENLSKMGQVALGYPALSVGLGKQWLREIL